MTHAFTPVDDAATGLPPKTLAALRRVLSGFAGVEKAVLYGSRATGRYREGSDIDLCLFGEITSTRLLRIEQALDALGLPYKIDLSAFHLIESEPLKASILREGRLL
ncbi:nucleotidyltransferase domain-containing protein [Fontimonas sp. SYSU GA230001]|uniref:nucleotidyltransferase family protein n=1 Tax=Fontimonas sp. SYSU GA230001 TaxID=3142450 RepID=UPI0032B5DB02